MSRSRLIFALSLAAISTSTVEPAQAAFHLWDIAEVFSTADGRVQYVEFTTTFNGQHVLGAHQITATSDGNTVSFTIPANLPAGTTNRRFIVATPGFSDLPGAIPVDYQLPCGPFFNPSAASITISLVGADSLTFTGAQLPTDGINALVDSTPDATPTLGSAAASPTNYGGTTGTLSLPACVIAGTCDPCDDGEFCNGPELCVNSACVQTPACPGLMCDELNDRCFECSEPSTCNDGNACTDDDCDPNGMCTNTPNTDPCDDGLFCTLTDACDQGTCQGTNSPCNQGETCLEGTDACGECAIDDDCDDGLFCNGVETCGAAACVAGIDPCQVGETCDEALGQCVPPDEPDAGVPDADGVDLGAPDLGGPPVDAGEDGGSPPQDAASADASSPAPDATSPAPDAASPSLDASSPAGDASVAANDAGTNGDTDDSCSCRVSDRSSPGTLAWWLALMGLVVLWRRRRV